MGQRVPSKSSKVKRRLRKISWMTCGRGQSSSCTGDVCKDFLYLGSSLDDCIPRFLEPSAFHVNLHEEPSPTKESLHVSHTNSKKRRKQPLIACKEIDLSQITTCWKPPRKAAGARQTHTSRPAQQQIWRQKLCTARRCR